MLGCKCISVRLLYSLLMPSASSTSLYNMTKILTPCCWGVEGEINHYPLWLIMWRSLGVAHWLHEDTQQSQCVFIDQRIQWCCYENMITSKNIICFSGEMFAFHFFFFFCIIANVYQGTPWLMRQAKINVLFDNNNNGKSTDWIESNRAAKSVLLFFKITLHELHINL